MTLRHTLRITPDDQLAHRYLPVPFEVSGQASLEVRLSYDTDAAVVDLGCEGPAGWRGWSGGARRRYVVSAGAATPGYLPGPLEDGEWSVVLGLHQIPAEGLEVVVEIDLPATGPAEPAAPPADPGPDRPRGSTRELPAPAGLRWLAGDFHAHTLHSDGAETIEELAARGVRAGLDFVAVTDHNTTSHHPHLPAAGARHGITLLPGQEVTTARGHANAFGDIGFVDFRTPAQEWVHEVAARGGVLSVNHPIEGDCSWQHPLSALPAALELWHISWFRDLTSRAALAFAECWDPAATLLGGSDFHTPADPWTLGTPTTWVLAADSTPEAILEAVAAGRTALSVGVRPDATPDPLGSPLLLRVEGELVALAAEGAVLVDRHGATRRVTSATFRTDPQWGEGPFHLELPDRRIVALTA